MNEVNHDVVVATLAIMALAIPLYVIPSIITQWKLYSKAHQPGWSCLVPVYGFYVFGLISKKNIRLVYAGVGLSALGYIVNLVNRAATVPNPVSLLNGLASLAFFVIWILVFIGFTQRYRASAGFWLTYLFVPIVAVFLVKKVTYIESIGTSSQAGNYAAAGSPVGQSSSPLQSASEAVPDQTNPSQPQVQYSYSSDFAQQQGAGQSVAPQSGFASAPQQAPTPQPPSNQNYQDRH